MYSFTVPEDIRVGSSLGSLIVEDPDEPQNRMTKYSIVQGEYRDTFTIETDPSRNEGVIRPMKVRAPQGWVLATAHQRCMFWGHLGSDEAGKGESGKEVGGDCRQGNPWGNVEAGVRE